MPLAGKECQFWEQLGFVQIANQDHYFLHIWIVGMMEFVSRRFAEMVL